MSRKDVALTPQAIEDAVLCVVEHSTNIEHALEPVAHGKTVSRLESDLKVLYDYATFVTGGGKLSQRSVTESLMRVMTVATASALGSKRLEQEEDSIMHIPDADHALASILRAASARLQMDSGQPVTPRYFGTLMGLHEGYVSRLRRTGVLPGGRSGINPKAAKAFVEERRARQSGGGDE